MQPARPGDRARQTAQKLRKSSSDSSLTTDIRPRLDRGLTNEELTRNYLYWVFNEQSTSEDRRYAMAALKAHAITFSSLSRSSNSSSRSSSSRGSRRSRSSSSDIDTLGSPVTDGLPPSCFKTYPKGILKKNSKFPEYMNPPSATIIAASNYVETHEYKSVINIDVDCTAMALNTGTHQEHQPSPIVVALDDTTKIKSSKWSAILSSIFSSSLKKTVIDPETVTFAAPGKFKGLRKTHRLYRRVKRRIRRVVDSIVSVF